MADTTASNMATITGQTASSGIGSDGQPGNGYNISFRTAQGYVGRVFVRADQFTPQKVQELVAEQARMLDAVGSTPVGY